MTSVLKDIIEKPYDNPEKPDVNNGIHAYMFIYDSSNKRTYQSMTCMIETIYEMEKTKKKGGGKMGGNKKKDLPFFPKKIIVGNKKDLRVNETAGKINREDILKLQEFFPNIKMKEVSALTN